MFAENRSGGPEAQIHRPARTAAIDDVDGFALIEVACDNPCPGLTKPARIANKTMTANFSQQPPARSKHRHTVVFPGYSATALSTNVDPMNDRILLLKIMPTQAGARATQLRWNLGSRAPLCQLASENGLQV